ncbi:MAG: zinc ribbon domain-containing protein [Elusimicrobia bacterium]|nr:zinc ribbon domain-containing protein [Elusimicrobiota bacterium]
MGSQTCPACKAENDDLARFCDQCGVPLPKAGADEECPACGGRLRPIGGGGGDCSDCGLHVPAPDPEPTAPAAAPAPPANMVPCPLCAEPTRDDAASCKSCGLWYETPRALQPCPRCGQPAGPDDCACGAILTLDRLLGFVAPGVRFVCKKCKSPFAKPPGDGTKCPACSGALLPAENLKAYARSLQG